MATSDATAAAAADKGMSRVESEQSVLNRVESADALGNDFETQWDALKVLAAADAAPKREEFLAALTKADAISALTIVAKLMPTMEDKNKKTAVARESACFVLAGLSNAFGRAAEPIIAPTLRAMLALTGDPAKFVQVSAVSAVTAFIQNLSPHAFKTVLPQLLGAMDGANKWQTIVGACDILVTVAKSEDETVRESVRNAMPDAVPAILRIISDFKKEVATASLAALEACCDLVSNRDLEPLLPVVIAALKDTSKRSETIQVLSSTTFVSTVNAASLAIIMPLLVSGFNERTTMTKRMCARIVTNMLKLVEDPRESAPFLPVLEPTLAKQKVEVSDPEARGVCEGAHEQIVRLSDRLKELPVMADTATRSARANELLRAAAPKSQAGASAAYADVSFTYAAGLVASLMEANDWEVSTWETCVLPYSSQLGVAKEDADKMIKSTLDTCLKEFDVRVAEVATEDDGEELCNCKFTLAYGSKILLHNTDMRLLRGQHYGLLGGNDSGKTTLLRAISRDQVDGFPPSTVLKTVFVEADILGDLSHLSCIDYIFEDERIQAIGCTREKVCEVLATVGFTEDGKARPNDPVSTLSGGWRMKLALARAMLQNADILLMDEPTNHLDVINVEWVINYLQNLRGVTSVIVSSNKILLNKVCQNILQISDLKLRPFKGNLEAFVKVVPAAMTYFDFKESKLSFSFPQPGPIEGVKNKGRPLMKMDGVAFCYPGNTKPTVSGVTVRASLASRVACVGVNGAGKSTMIKLLTGELMPGTGTVWKHPAARVGYIAQHAFHHIEQHLTKTANEYIQWRYSNGEDKETLEKVTFVITEEEEKKCAEPIMWEIKNENGDVTGKEKRVIEKLTGARRAFKKEHEYETKWMNKDMDHNSYLSTTQLEAYGFTKHMKKIDEREALRAGMYIKPATKANVEAHLTNVGLEPEFATHHRMSALSGGQKVKVVLAASLWNRPHVLILDEPTNYLDRESLGALAGAIREYEGGVIMITHNNDFCSELCPETWVLENGTLNCKGDAEWMATALKEKVDDTAQQIAAEDALDKLGNKVKVKSRKKLSNKEKKAKAKQRQFKIDNGLEVSSDEDWM